MRPPPIASAYLKLSSVFVGQQLQWKNGLGAHSQLTCDTRNPRDDAPLMF